MTAFEAKLLIWQSCRDWLFSGFIITTQAVLQSPAVQFEHMVVKIVEVDRAPLTVEARPAFPDL